MPTTGVMGSVLKSSMLSIALPLALYKRSAVQFEILQLMSHLKLGHYTFWLGKHPKSQTTFVGFYDVYYVKIHGRLECYCEDDIYNYHE